eukprot:CAMPEP_0179887732 /NCGR_PEP_ID=MMETSP0982-20121206/31567_1 /TAXON_ID=483367 /ORGANISM="non described non described, Strain CCMP 2436" /LENGTH=74 /DNA_ID=CAMNT_0021783591 /DNA_START=766 /DNA_END=990 /DNA_ORIENTATION=+
MPMRQRLSTAEFQRHWAALLKCIPQHLEVPFLGSTLGGHPVPRAAVLVRVPQHLEVPFLSSIPTSEEIPRAAVL